MSPAAVDKEKLVEAMKREAMADLAYGQFSVMKWMNRINSGEFDLIEPGHIPYRAYR